MELSCSPLHRPEALGPYTHAALIVCARVRLAQLVVSGCWTCASSSSMFMVAPRTAENWADRFRAEAAAGTIVDQSSLPTTSPHWTSSAILRQIMRLRGGLGRRPGPVQIAGSLRMQASTVHAVLVRRCVRLLTGPR